MNPLDYCLARATLVAFDLLGRIASGSGRLSGLQNSQRLQPLISRLSRLYAWALFQKAARECPAYRMFLQAEGYTPTAKWNLREIPVMTKENFVRRYSLEDRCYGGKLPYPGAVIDESAASTGLPVQWIRSAAELEEAKRHLQRNWRRSRSVLLNCYTLGTWFTGIHLSTAFSGVGILRSIGPDCERLTNALKTLGPKYEYVLFGYPPFIRIFVDSCDLDLSLFNIDVLVGGEGISEAFRSHLLKSVKSVSSGYGASDLGANIGGESQLTIAIRKLCAQTPALAQKIFGRQTVPMIFQYNPNHYLIETNQLGELLFTACRNSAAEPKIRYNLRDAGGIYSFRELAVRLKEQAIELDSLVPRASRLPFLFVHGRSDDGVIFCALKISPIDIEQILLTEPDLAKGIGSFQLATAIDEKLVAHLTLHLERSKLPTTTLPDETVLAKLVFDGLIRVRQDFHDLSVMFSSKQFHGKLHEAGTGPFVASRTRVKNRYINRADLA
jgi:phenylacetate-CoA ligase